jgi:POT family proton-dependent oligopeptide transporter
MATATASATESTEKHPKGLYVLFASEMWERYSFYTVNAMLALYLTNRAEGFSFTNAQAATVQGWYLAFVYFTPLFGGLLADLYLGFRKAILIGAVFFIAGHALLAVPDNIMIVYAALCCLVVGNGFFKPNVSSMVGNLYKEGSHLKDRAYLIFYMGINIGAGLAPLVAAFIQPRWGFHPAFFMGAIGMMISMVIFSLNQKHVRHADRIRGKVPGDFARDDASKGHQEAVTTSEDLPPMTEASRIMQAVPEWKRIVALIVIFLIVIVFWMVFHQNSLTLTFWAEDHTQWTFIRAGGIFSNSINAIFIVLLVPVLVWFWGWLDKKGLEPSTPTKMMIGMTLTGLSMVVLYFGARANGYTAPVFRVEKVDSSGTWVSIAKEAREHLGIAIPPTKIEIEDDGKPVTIDAWRVNHQGPTPARDDFARLESHDATQITTGATTKASLWWLIAMYGVISLGELMLSPMGLALVSKVAPVRWRGLMMGGWFTATAIGNKLTSIGGYWDLWSHTKFFLVLGGMAFVMAIVLFALLRPLKKAMPGV